MLQTAALPKELITSAVLMHGPATLAVLSLEQWDKGHKIDAQKKEVG